jgi:hypothetical protein
LPFFNLATSLSFAKFAWASLPLCARPSTRLALADTLFPSFLSSFLGIWIYIGFAYTKTVGIRSYSESNPAALFWVCFFILLQATASLLFMWKQRMAGRLFQFYHGAPRFKVMPLSPTLLLAGFNLCMSFLCTCA